MAFTNTPVSRLLLISLISGSILASLLDVKHYFYISLHVHIWRYQQFWRLLTYQLCYANSAEVLFAAITLYHLRVVERMWGSRKYASFLVVSYVIASVTVPAIAMFLRPITAGLFDYVPAGPTPLIFAALAQYHAMIPHLYKYRIAISETPPTNDLFSGLTLSDKSLKYAVAIHLSLLQWPGSVLAAVVGWVTGYAWREGLLPAACVRWRLPAWMLGISAHRRSREFEGLRRRLEGEGSTATATATATGAAAGGAQGEGQTQPERRRTMGQQIIDQFRDAL